MKERQNESCVIVGNVFDGRPCGKDIEVNLLAALKSFLQ